MEGRGEREEREGGGGGRGEEERGDILSLVTHQIGLKGWSP